MDRRLLEQIKKSQRESEEYQKELEREAQVKQGIKPEESPSEKPTKLEPAKTSKGLLVFVFCAGAFFGILADRISIGAARTQSPAPTRHLNGFDSATGVIINPINVFASPTGASPVCSLKHGAEVELLDEGTPGGRVKIRSGGCEGWLLGDFVGL